MFIDLFILYILGDKTTIMVLIVGSLAAAMVAILIIVIVTKKASEYKREVEEYDRTISENIYEYIVSDL